MSMSSNSNLSSYLVRSDLTPRRQRNWAGFRVRSRYMYRSNPRIIYRTMVALLIWTAVVASARYAMAPKNLTTQSAFSESGGVASLAQAASFNKAAPSSSLSRAEPIQPSLPAGPSGAAQQPTALAPYRTYANSYAPGQCTWYVASRRPIPKGWGNANSWYRNAAAAGWKVGSTPQVGAVAWTAAGWYGHVALVEKVSDDGKSVYVSEMNYVAPYYRDNRWVSTTAFKYIY